NLHQLALSAKLDYSTVEHHIRLMEKHSIVECTGAGYGRLYFTSDSPGIKEYMKEKLEGEGYENKKTVSRKIR
ncbi:MAG: hypothetical protein V1728_02080, partial [Candidatus Micrarchaeota archaeon]